MYIQHVKLINTDDVTSIAKLALKYDDGTTLQTKASFTILPTERVIAENLQDDYPFSYSGYSANIVMLGYVEKISASGLFSACKQIIKNMMHV